MMRFGRSFKSLILLCVTVVPVLYVFYAKLDNTGSTTRLKVAPKRTELTTKEKEQNRIIATYISSFRNHPPIQPTNTRSFTPERYDRYKQSSIDNSLADITSAYDFTTTTTESVINGDAILASQQLRGSLDDQASRIRNLRLSCARHETKECMDVRKCNLTEFYYSKQYKFAYCKVPKSGSTFWMKLFLVLFDSYRYSKVLNTLSRNDIHMRAKSLIAPPMPIIRDKIPTIVVSRNPYSRLYSAYVDKVFMPLFWGQFKTMNGVTPIEPFWINKTVDALKKSNQPLPQRLIPYRVQMEKRGILKKINISNKVTPICANNASFEDFLKFIIAEVKAERSLEPHWAPISDLCKPCMFNTQHIIKQEHFSEDVNATLTAFNINATGFDVIRNEVLGKRVENSIPGIIRVIERKSTMADVRMCIPNREIVRRLWKAFQIQGYIRDEEEVPEDLLTDRFDKSKIISSAIGSVKRAPMTTEERSNQRHAHLTKAYQNIGDDIIAAIQEIFRSDFELFDYPLAPPV